MISAETLKGYLKIDGTTNDAFLGVCIENAVGEVKTYCNRKLEAGEYIDYLDGDCGMSFFVSNYPLTGIMKIEYFDCSGWSALIDSTSDYYIVPELNRVHLTGKTLPRGESNVRITYQAGWNVNDCPADLRGAITEMASMYYYNSPVSGKARLGMRSENMASQASESLSFKDLDWQSKVRKYQKTLVR